MRRHSIIATLVAVCALLPNAAFAVPGDPEPGTPEWRIRDAQNMADANGRLEDEYANPAFGRTFWTTTIGTYFSNVSDQALHPNRPILTLAQWIPGGTTADPYRVHWDDELGRGNRQRIEYSNRYGARIEGNVFYPKLPCKDPVTGTVSGGPFPSVVVTTGSIQGYQELYFWAAQGLAESCYVVMTYDVQGQGHSETFAHHPDGSLWCDQSSCPGVPFQQADNFYSGTTDALDWFVSTANPVRSLVDESRIGLAGHSLGAGAVTAVGNRDARVAAVVAWDNAALDAGQAPRVPTMGQNAEYFFNQTPTHDLTGYNSKIGTFEKFKTAGVPSMQVALRSSMHLEWTYVPYILPASKTGERVAMYYTLAWFDRYLKGGGTLDGAELSAEQAAQRADAARRLTATSFDNSADRSAIGAGAWDPTANANVPHEIAGDAVAGHLSFYFRSAYAFDGYGCADMREGC